MSDEQPTITTTVEHDGAVMLNAADMVAWLRYMADYFGDGKHGGTLRARAAARDAINKTADSLQSGYVNACADDATYWFGGSA